MSFRGGVSMMIDINKLRSLRGFRKQTEIAREIGISQNYYSQIENGVRKPSLKMLLCIASFFGVSISDIVLEHYSNLNKRAG
jgi:transcriptional regulator with XRE-family HTH domain